MIEIAALATTIVGTILVPFLKQGADQLVKKLAERSSDAAADGLVDRAGSLWDRIRGKAAGTDDEPVVDVFAAQPEKLQSSMTGVLEAMMQADPAFRAELERLVDGNGGGTEQWNIMASTVGIVKAQHISGGTVAGVLIDHGSAEPSPRRAE